MVNVTQRWRWISILSEIISKFSRHSINKHSKQAQSQSHHRGFQCSYSKAMTSGHFSSFFLLVDKVVQWFLYSQALAFLFSPKDKMCTSMYCKSHDCFITENLVVILGQFCKFLEHLLEKLLLVYVVPRPQIVTKLLFPRTIPLVFLLMTIL